MAGEHSLRVIEGTEQVSSFIGHYRGITSRPKTPLYMQARLVSDVIVHEDYDAFNFYNNICIVKLSQDLVFDRRASTGIG